ncbi:MAG: protein meaA [Microthrixaceae bacterium]
MGSQPDTPVAPGAPLLRGTGALGPSRNCAERDSARHPGENGVMPTESPRRSPDRPWMMRTYSGHSTAQASNALYRTNLAKGQTGLSIAFDLPTQTGYDPDDRHSQGEVGKVGVPVAHLGHMATLLDGIPQGEMNTSMTINAPAAWMLGLYVANARAHGVESTALRGTTQNDIVKEYLSRGTYIFGPVHSRRLIVDMFAFCNTHVPKWNPMNVCSYHLQEAGATPTQEIAYALATAIGVLDAVRDSGQVPADKLPEVVASISFFVNAGIRFVEETAKMRAFTKMWDRITEERYGVSDPKARRFRYGVQVNSLGLTEAQPENNVQRIVLEALGVTLSRDARARSLQLPAWNEALGLPRPWDQQWSLRIQQVLALETDLLEYDDLFEGSHVMEALTESLMDSAQAELDEVLAMGGAFEAIDELKGRLVRSHTERMRRIEQGELQVVGVNCFTEAAESPLGGNESILTVDPAVAAETIADVETWREVRDQGAVKAALDELERVARTDENIMAATIALAEAGGTTGEWAGVLREVFGEYRAPTGVGTAAGAGPANEGLAAVASRVQRLEGGPIRLLVAKPGLDGHSNGAEQIAVAARDAGMEVIYGGIRLTPEQIAAAARDEDVEVVGLSILSGSHLELVPEVVRLLEADGVDVPVVVGGIIPPDDGERLLESGITAVYTPKDFELATIMDDIAELAIGRRNGALAH